MPFGPHVVADIRCIAENQLVTVIRWGFQKPPFVTRVSATLTCPESANRCYVHKGEVGTGCEVGAAQRSNRPRITFYLQLIRKVYVGAPERWPIIEINGKDAFDFVNRRT